jgi:hypothetical protein
MIGYEVDAGWRYFESLRKTAEDYVDLDWICGGQDGVTASLELLVVNPKKETSKDIIQNMFFEAVGGSWLEVFGPFDLCGCGDFLNQTDKDSCEYCQKAKEIGNDI